MKRFWGILLAMALLCVPALAEEIDLSAMSLDELVELQMRVHSEIAARTAASEDIIREGQYTVDQGIAPGNYEFTCTKKRETNSSEFAAISLHQNNNLIQFIRDLSVGDVVYLHLESEMILEISNCEGTLSVAAHAWSN